jgi:hypothetical protein
MIEDYNVTLKMVIKEQLGLQHYNNDQPLPGL